MDEFEFQRVLNLFPIVRPRDYHADLVSSRQSTAQPAQSEVQKEWRDAWDATDGKEIEIEGNEPDAFWRKLKMTAEKKVNEELSLEAAKRHRGSNRSS
ncbi:uncharacterized protein LOC130767019 isoform X2 [Actinidia eriantha]|uniref:uncharacterized protein LOC130767019 isoform X2 n=1 Tax=Actinidia eriantha TaxID=165200 RepID=UPI0025902444|nr:uncharacterized protein LOC130767019 isoform X2 [Actinidia eriantha]